MKKYRRVMSYDTEEWSKENLIFEKDAFFVWCSRLEAVSGSTFKVYGKSLTTVLDINFIVNLYSFLLSLVPQANSSFPEVSHLPPLSFKISLKDTFFHKLPKALSLSPECLLNFLLNVYTSSYGKNFQIYGVHIPRKCIDWRHFYSCPPHSKLALKYLSSRHRQKEMSRFPRQHSFENRFPQQ